MKFKILGNELANLVKVLDKMVDDVKLKVENNNLVIDTVNIGRTMFAKFKVAITDAEDGEIGVRMKDLKMVSNMFKKDEVEFIGKNGYVLVTNGKKRIKIPEIEIEEEVPELPEFNTDVKIVIDASELKQLIKDIKNFGDDMVFDGKVVKAYSDVHEYEYELEDYDGPERKIIVGIDLISVPIVYNSKEYIIRYGEETPFIVEAEGEFGEAIFVIAPRIDDEE